jgi:hypothetical protein
MERESMANGLALADQSRTTWESRVVRATVDMAIGKQRKPRPIELLTAKRGWVYFVQAHCGSIKIGRARDVQFRLKELQCANPHKLTLLAVAVDGGNEVQYHRKFAAHRLLGEWFAPHPDILAEIERLTT